MIPKMKKVERSNVPSLVCVFAASATTGGTMYSFGIFGEALKQTLRLSQSELNTISSAMFIAGLFSWIPGLIVDRYGTKFSLCLGGLMGTLSTLAYWVFARQFVAIRAIVPTLSIMGMLTCMSCAMIVGSVFKIILVSCRAGNNKGVAVGVAKGYVGLGAGVYTCVFEAIRQPNQSPLDFLPMSAFFFFLIAFLPGVVLLSAQDQVAKEHIVDKTTTTHFRVLYLSLLLMAIVVVGSVVADLLEGDDTENDRVVIIEQSVPTRKYCRALFILAIWLGPIVSLMFLPEDEGATPYKPWEEDKRKREQKKKENHDLVVETLFMASPVASSNNLLKAFSSATELRHELSVFVSPSREVSSYRSTPDMSGLFGVSHANVEQQVMNGKLTAHEETFLLADIETETASYTHDDHPVSPTESHYYDDQNFNLVQMLSEPSAWLMLWTCTMVVGSGTLQTNNIGEMVASRGFPERVAPACLALFSVSQATARVVTGAISEAALNWKHHSRSCFVEYGIPRPFFLVIASAVACLAHLILSFASEISVFVSGSIFSGIAFGMVWPLLVLIVGEVFGLPNHGANYMFYE